MKGIKLFLAGCLGLLVFQAAIAVDTNDTARAAARRDTATTTARQKSGNQPSKTTGRGGGRVAPASSAVQERATTKIPARASGSAQNNVSPRTTVTRTVSERNNTEKTSGTRVARKNENTNISRTTTTRAASAARNTTTRAKSKAAIKQKSRATTTTGITGAISANYAACRKTYYDCMDEFCANKDSQLRRCACSARASEFTKAKKQLDRVEEKMQDFNQRLLTVSMDAEDVRAMNTASEGEEAYYDTSDKTDSQKMLNDISKRLNDTFGDNAKTGMGAISLSLNTDSAFDSIDSFMGADTTSKSGTNLYRAALPVCREMVLETCSQEELSLAESGYQMQIEQDCNTVAKSYQSQSDQARAKVLESSALLDISRLDVYQKRNSDDILTCKKKMLDILTDSTVCGNEMEKCLDITGQYIDPTTGKAFLTNDLSNLGTLLTRPGENESWETLGDNAQFVSFLKNKKEYIKPAMENCQNIADQVWTSFIPDALAQIKLAQEAKLEEIRQACTTLLSECLTGANESVTNFDARALSIFGVSTDLTVNQMCADVKNACKKLMSHSTRTEATASGDDWGTGIDEIQTNKTYQTILSACTQVGQNCIIQSCKSLSGNFGLCTDILTSTNRHTILNGSACWQDVMDCVAKAGDTAIKNIMKMLNKGQSGDTPGDRIEYSDNTFDNEIYRLTEDEYVSAYGEIDNGPATTHDEITAELFRYHNINHLCNTQCGTSYNPVECGKCLLTERIWGNCEQSPANASSQADSTNYILKPSSGNDTLMSWFAKNTNTLDNPKACINTRCNRRIMIPPTILQPGEDSMCVDDLMGNSGLDDTRTEGDNRFCPIPTGQYYISNDDSMFYTEGTYSNQSDPTSDVTNFLNLSFFRYTPSGTEQERCCWSMATDDDGISTTTPSDSGETYLGHDTCCHGTPARVHYYEYSGIPPTANSDLYSWNTTQPDSGAQSICLPSTYISGLPHFNTALEQYEYALSNNANSNVTNVIPNNTNNGVWNARLKYVVLAKNLDSTEYLICVSTTAGYTFNCEKDGTCDQSTGNPYKEMWQISNGQSTLVPTSLTMLAQQSSHTQSTNGIKYPHNTIVPCNGTLIHVQKVTDNRSSDKYSVVALSRTLSQQYDIRNHVASAPNNLDPRNPWQIHQMYPSKYCFSGANNNTAASTTGVIQYVLDDNSTAFCPDQPYRETY